MEGFIKFSLSSSTEAFIKLNTLLMWGYAPHARTSFLFTKKGCKDVSKRRCPLGNLLGGKYPPQSLRDAPPLIHQTFMISVGGSVTALREGMVLVRKVNWFCFPSPENRIKFDFHGDGASF